MTPIEAYARRAVPRYTSYPTAPHFRSGFAEATFRGWLGALDPAEPLSLYLHVPFCRQMCWYCGCNMKLAARYAPVAGYVDSLLDEIDLIAAALPARMGVGHLHWGGGTPTALSPDDLERAMDRIRARFALAPGAEVAIESDPRTLTEATTAAIGRLGFTRASFGVQEFDPRVQAAINRVQPPELVARTVAGLRAAGVAGINFDLIYGLPHQTVATLLDTVACCVEMRPDRIALFGYAHVPWTAKNQRMIPAEALPDVAARAEQAACAAAALVAAGYQPIGIDHFALPGDPLAAAARAGRLRRNFQGYTTDDAAALVGIGATAIGRTRFGYVQNLAETGAWARAVAAGRLPVAKGLALGDDDRRRAAVIEAIMCAGEATLPADVGGETERAALAAMADDGLVTLEGDRLRLTEAGRPLARVVAAVFDAYLATASARHSVAV